MERRKYIAIVSAAAVVIVVAVCVYLAQLSATVAGNLMTSVDEISRHDVETIEGTLNNCYARWARWPTASRSTTCRRCTRPRSS